jgi:hypothetical protein
MIGDSMVTVDTDIIISVKDKEYQGTKGLWELLTRKNVRQSKISTEDLKNYKSIIEATNAHLEDYKPTGNIQISKGLKYRQINASLFAESRKRGKETALRQKWLTLH